MARAIEPIPSADVAETVQSQEASPTRGRASKAQILLSVLLVLGGLAAFLWLFLWHLVPPKAPTFKDPSILDVLMGSRLIIGIVRLIALVLALYLVISVLALIGAKRWLIGFPGGMTTDKIEDRQQLQAQLAVAEAKYENLAAEYARVVDLLRQTVEAQGVDVERGGS